MLQLHRIGSCKQLVQDELFCHLTRAASIQVVHCSHNLGPILNKHTVLHVMQLRFLLPTHRLISFQPSVVCLLRVLSCIS